MVSTDSLLKRLKNDNPEVTFTSSDTFCWSPSSKTIYYSELKSEYQKSLLLHELSHALLGHSDFEQDISLLNYEMTAWELAKTDLSDRYGVDIIDDDINDALNSYRDWLNERSKCPNCNNNAPQTKTGPYKCLICGCQWRANDARLCQLRRYKLKSV